MKLKIIESQNRALKTLVIQSPMARPNSFFHEKSLKLPYETNGFQSVFVDTGTI